MSRRKKIVGVLDIGTTKVVCLIASYDPEPRLSERAGDGLRVLGVSHQGSRGVNAGVITDLDEAEVSVRAAVAAAERMAGVRLDEVCVAVGCGRLRSRNFTATTEVESGVVGESDIARILAGGRSFAERDGRALLHMNRIGFRLDGAAGARDPRGMAAGTLAADLNAVTADEAPLRNLLLVVERCYLLAASLVPSPFASALAVTTEEERRLGVTLIDIGGGTTTLAMFAEGQLIHVDATEAGGSDAITFDIARQLHTPLAESARIKALYGTLVVAQSDGYDCFSYPLTGEEDGGVGSMTKAQLAELIRPRVDELARQIEDRLEQCPVSAFAAGRIVLTGGGSQLAGMADYFANRLGRPVRVARPRSISGLPQAVSSPAFATAAGLLVAAAVETRAADSLAASGDLQPQGYLNRVGEWLRQGF